MCARLEDFPTRALIKPTYQNLPNISRYFAERACTCTCTEYTQFGTASVFTPSFPFQQPSLTFSGRLGRDVHFFFLMAWRGSFHRCWLEGAWRSPPLTLSWRKWSKNSKKQATIVAVVDGSTRRLIEGLAHENGAYLVSASSEVQHTCTQWGCRRTYCVRSQSRRLPAGLEAQGCDSFNW